MANRLLWAFIYFENALCHFHLPWLASCVVFFVRFLFSAQIPASVRIGKGTIFGYGGLGVVIHGGSVIGENCRIGTAVVLGARYPSLGAPVIGDNVYIAAGAKILGPVTVGSNSVIGANAVVISDIPPSSIAVGVPAVIKKREINIEDYNENYFSGRY